MSEEIAQILERAADRLSKPGAWTQDASCRDEHGLDLDSQPEVDRDTAVCFCMSEAIWRESGLRFDVCPAHQFVATLLGEHIPSWNDAPERTQEEVVQTLREAAAKARAGQ